MGHNRYRIGVDVGGTNTDSVLINTSQSTDKSTRGVIASYKHATTPDVTTGIELAVRKVLEKGGLTEKLGEILSLTIGTTHFINAVLQSNAKRLSKVAVVRLAAPYTSECPPFSDFPNHLKRIIYGHAAILKGGLQVNGEVINDIDEEELVKEANAIKQKKINSVVIVGVYSPLDTTGQQEYKARSILQRELGNHVHIVCSRDVAQIGFLERENASILNASILSFARHTIISFQNAMKRLGLKCPLYLTQNDGTLTSASEAAKLPVRTFNSGATNSMRGAGYLGGFGQDDESGSSQGRSVIVVDIGGTSTDVGVVLPSGYPRLSGAYVEIAGVRTNFSMPDVHSIGLGGGTRIHCSEGGQVRVGPDSVGNRLLQDAKIFGGGTLTTTDLTVHVHNLQDIGDPTLVKDISMDVVEKGQNEIYRLLSRTIDRMKTSPENIDVLLVGGGSIICPSALKGVNRIIKPPHYEVANAIGAAIASISGDVDTILIPSSPNPTSDEINELVEGVKQRALERAIERGAKGGKEKVRIVRVDVVPLAYVANGALRIVVKAVGELGSGEGRDEGRDDDDFGVEEEEWQSGLYDDGDVKDDYEHSARDEDHKTGDIDYESYTPKVVDNEWMLSQTDLLFVMEGCGVLGTGGGGSPYSTYLICKELLCQGQTIRVVDHKSLPSSGYLARGAFMGSPSVGAERLRDPRHILQGARELAKYCGNVKFVATFSDEIGGSNGLQALATSGYMNLPAFDGDLMGRAYPRVDQITASVYNRPNALIPCALSDGNGNVILLTNVKNDKFVETILRTVTTEMGSCAALIQAPLAVSDARDYGITRCLSLAWRIGRAICICRQKNMISRVAEKILECQNGACLFVGKIVQVSREVRAGFTWGYVQIAPLLDEEKEELVDDDKIGQYRHGTMLRIPFQNENLCAFLEKPDGTQNVLASVPDLITVLDSQTGSHLGTPEYTYGLRVTVIAMAGHPLWKTEIGLKAGGPQAFGFEHAFVPIAEYREPESVVEGYI